jgi:cysteine-rich repeat protein
MGDRKSLRTRALGLSGAGNGGRAATARLLFAMSGTIGLAFACTVVDKADYEFEGVDEDGDSGSGGTAGKGGSTGKGGSAGSTGKGGTSGEGGATGGGAGDGQGESGSGNEGGSGADGATGGTSGSAGQGEGGAPEGGTGGGTAGVGAEGGTGGEARCGNGRTEPGEDCDDGNTDTETCTYGEQSCTICASNCRSGPGSVRYCGDGRIDSEDGERCDDSNAVTEVCDYGLTSCTVCGSTCTADVGQTYYCGDGVTSRDFGEECDEGTNNSNTVPNRCRTNCKEPICGDRVRDDGEGCDDGGQVSGDGCSPDCHLEPRLSCKHWRSEGATEDRVYTIDPDGYNGPITPFPVLCDMTTDGGGWTLTYKVANNVPSSAQYWFNAVLLGTGDVFPTNLMPPGNAPFEGPTLAVRGSLANMTNVAEWRATQMNANGRVFDVKSGYAGGTGIALRCFATGLGDCGNVTQSCSVYPDAYVLYNVAATPLPTNTWGHLCDIGWSTCPDCVDWSAIQTTSSPSGDLTTVKQYVGDSAIQQVDTVTAFWVR